MLANPEFHVILYYDSYDFMKHVSFSQIKTDLAYKPLAGYTHWTFAYEGKEISKRGQITGKRVYSLGQKVSMTATAYYYEYFSGGISKPSRKGFCKGVEILHHDRPAIETVPQH